LKFYNHDELSHIYFDKVLAGRLDCIEADGRKWPQRACNSYGNCHQFVAYVQMPITEHMLQMLWLVDRMENNKVNGHCIQISIMKHKLWHSYPTRHRYWYVDIANLKKQMTLILLHTPSDHIY